jgi:hypothetical protein
VRILVCGGRDYDDRARVFQALDLLAATRGMSMLIHGGARGADSLAGEWAAARRIPETVYPVHPMDWKTLGPRAGPLRNQYMLDDSKPDAVVAFPGGRGTADMIARAEKAGLKVWRPYG